MTNTFWGGPDQVVAQLFEREILTSSETHVDTRRGWKMFTDFPDTAGRAHFPFVFSKVTVLLYYIVAISSFAKGFAAVVLAIISNVTSAFDAKLQKVSVQTELSESSAQ